MLRVVCMALMNIVPVVTTVFGAAYAVQPAYGIGFHKDVYLWIPVLGNILAVLVIPFVGNLSDRIGRRPPIIVGALGSGLLSFGYLYAISIHNVPLAIIMSLLMWGIVFRATTPSSRASIRNSSRPARGSRRWRSRRTWAPPSRRCCRRSSPRWRLRDRRTFR